MATKKPKATGGTVPYMHRDLASRLNLEIVYDGGIKIKTAQWTAPMSYPDSFAMLVRLAREQGVELTGYLRELP